jgi:ComF family protein
MSLLDDFISLIYPRICMACGIGLYRNEEYICTRCRHHLPRTHFHLDNENPVMKMFWGRVQLAGASAYYYFDRGNKVQNLLHQLKYNGQKELGVCIGELYGQELKKEEKYSSIDYVIPVPLHLKKERKRGYNQSEMFALGLAKSMEKIMRKDLIFRNRETETQTKKAKFRRWENVEKIFSIAEKQELEHKHVLLVDDVVTTGATLESCAQELLSVNGTKVTVATIAFADL